MIICTKCGCANEDQCHLCISCGHKLLSRSRPGPQSAGPGFLSPMESAPLPEDVRSVLMKMLESWVYIAVLGAAGIVCVIMQSLWPIFPAAGAIGLAAFLRKI